MTYLPPANGGRVNVTIGGNTAGASTLISSGTMTLVGGNNVTLSQNGNAITISGGAGGGAGSNTFGMSNLGNSIGTSGVVSGSALRYAFAGGNNVTLSQSLNGVSGTLTISAANQSVQTQNLHNVTLGGNTAGVMAQVSSGTLTLVGGNNVTLSQNGNAVTISAGAGGGGGGIALANSQTAYTSGTANLAVAGGAMTIASTTGQSFNFSVPQTSSMTATGIVSISTNGSTISIGAPAFSAGMSNIGNTSGISGPASNQVVFAGGNNITLSQATGAGGNTITISAAAGGAGAIGSYFDNMFQQNSVQGITYTSVSTGIIGRLLIQPLAPGNELFPYDMTASTMFLGFSNSGSSAISAAHSSSWYIGIYTRANSTQLSLLNSVSTSYGMAANVSNSASYLGARWLSFQSSQWSSQPSFKAGSRYFFAVMPRTAGATYASISMGGMHLGQSVQRSGMMASASSGNTSFNAWHPFMGVHATTTFTALPVSIGNAEINKASVYANFIPQAIFDAGLGPMA